MSNASVPLDTQRVVADLMALPPQEQKSVLKRLQRPRITNNSLLLLVVGSICVVMVGSFVALALSIFLKIETTNSTQMVLTIFTTVVSFLAGLFTQSTLNPLNGDANDEQGKKPKP